MVVFLTELYQKSQNCQLEFKYALSCGKPFIFIFVEPNTVVEKWIEPHVNAWPTYELFTKEDFNILKNGIPRVNLIAQAIRDIAFAQPKMIEYDLSEEVISLKELLTDALNEIDPLNAKSRFKLCTRCNKEYEEINPNGCKKHTAYYVGGTIIAVHCFVDVFAFEIENKINISVRIIFKLCLKYFSRTFEFVDAQIPGSWFFTSFS